MATRELDSLAFRDMLEAGFNNLRIYADEVNDLNVFPIPDGDTGDNMSATLYGGIKAIKAGNFATLSDMAESLGNGMLLGARGNSGVILSQMFAGIVATLKDYDIIDAAVLSKAFQNGVKQAYQSVANPVEGTMLTVLRESSEYAGSRVSDDSTIDSYFDDYLSEAQVSLAHTPDLLPVLKEAGVIDSGGAGIKYIAQGFIKYLNGEQIEAKGTDDVPNATKDIDFSLFNEDSVMEYGYCTEFLLQLTRSKTNIDTFSLEEMKAKLSTFGDSLVAVKTGSIVKIHVHTLTPGAVLSFAQQFGEFLTLKIENMTLQHNEKIAKPAGEFTRIETRRPYGVVAVSDGEGLISTFHDLGADIVIDGGQGNNPSVETFIKAYEACNSDEIFVLPDNSNILMAARESANIYTDSKIRIIPTKSIGEGYVALSSLDYSSNDGDAIAYKMSSDVAEAICGSISTAVRDTTIHGLTIRSGQYIGFIHKDILVAQDNRIDATIGLAKEIVERGKSFLVAFLGADVGESEAEAIASRMASDFPAVEFYTAPGGQSVFDVILIAE